MSEEDDEIEEKSWAKYLKDCQEKQLTPSLSDYLVWLLEQVDND